MFLSPGQEHGVLGHLVAPPLAFSKAIGAVMYRRHIGKQPALSGLEFGASASWLGIHGCCTSSSERKPRDVCCTSSLSPIHTKVIGRRTSTLCRIPPVTNTRENTSLTYSTDTLGPVQLPNVRNSKHVMKIQGAIVTGQLVTSSHEIARAHCQAGLHLTVVT